MTACATFLRILCRCVEFAHFARPSRHRPCQTLGAILGSAFMFAVLPDATLNATHLGGCRIGPNITQGGAFVAEFMFTFVLLFIAYGCALDARQGAVFGPVRGGSMWRARTWLYRRRQRASHGTAVDCTRCVNGRMRRVCRCWRRR